MSRPFRLLSLSLLALSLGLAGCRTSTPYTAMYSPRKSYFVPPPERKDKAVEEMLSANELLLQNQGTAPSGLPPADPSAAPGMPPAGLPPAAAPVDPLAPPPAL